MDEKYYSATVTLRRKDIVDSETQETLLRIMNDGQAAVEKMIVEIIDANEMTRQEVAALVEAANVAFPHGWSAEAQGSVVVIRDPRGGDYNCYKPARVGYWIARASQETETK